MGPKKQDEKEKPQYRLITACRPATDNTRGVLPSSLGIYIGCNDYWTSYLTSIQLKYRDRRSIFQQNSGTLMVILRTQRSHRRNRNLFAASCLAYSKVQCRKPILVFVRYGRPLFEQGLYCLHRRRFTNQVLNSEYYSKVTTHTSGSPAITANRRGVSPS